MSHSADKVIVRMGAPIENMVPGVCYGVTKRKAAWLIEMGFARLVHADDRQADVQDHDDTQVSDVGTDWIDELAYKGPHGLWAIASTVAQLVDAEVPSRSTVDLRAFLREHELAAAMAYDEVRNGSA